MKKIKKIKLFGITIIRIETFQKDKRINDKVSKKQRELDKLIAKKEKLLNK